MKFLLLAGLIFSSITAFPQSTQVGNLKVLGNITSTQNLINGYATTVTAAGTTTLTVNSAGQQYFTGSTTQTCVLPVVSTLVLGQKFQIINNSSGAVTVNSSGGNTLQAMAASTKLTATVISLSGTGIASWSFDYGPNLGGSVTSVAMSVPSFLSISGSPVTTSGTLVVSLSGTALPILNGGTGQTTANAALNAFLPTQTGNAGKFLTTNATNSSWASVVATAAFNVVSKTTTYSAIANDYVLASSSSFTITLPTAVGILGQSIAIQHAGTSLTQVYTVATTSGQTLNGANGAIAGGSLALYTTGEVFVFTSDNVNWQITSHLSNTPWTNVGTNTITATAAYTFTIPSSSITAGTVYTNNGQTFTVPVTTSASTTLTCYGTGSPSASGTLTFVSGSPSGNLAFSASTTTGQPTLGSATVTLNKLSWKRNGPNADIKIEFKMTAAGTATAGSGDYLFLIPVTADTSVVTAFGGAGVASGFFAPTNNLGTTYGAYVGTNEVSGGVFLYDSTHVRIGGTITTVGGAAGTIIASSSNFAFTQSPTYMATFSYPVPGWQP